MLDDVESIALGDEDIPEQDTDENIGIDLGDELDKDIDKESVLDEEQVGEVSEALSALESNDTKKEDFASLKEPDVAHALGEELENVEEENQDAQTQEYKPQDSQHQSQEIVKNMIANSVQSSISSLSSNNLKSMLDGLEVTINISFKDKSK